jgi:hypothetical protein
MGLGVIKQMPMIRAAPTPILVMEQQAKKSPPGRWAKKQVREPALGWV